MKNGRQNIRQRDADFLQQLLKDEEVAKYFKSSELEKLCSLDFHFKQIKPKFKKLGLIK
jgi:hypothetical protein